MSTMASFTDCKPTRACNLDNGFLSLFRVSMLMLYFLPFTSYIELLTFFSFISFLPPSLPEETEIGPLIIFLFFNILSMSSVRCLFLLSSNFLSSRLGCLIGLSFRLSFGLSCCTLFLIVVLVLGGIVGFSFSWSVSVSVSLSLGSLASV